jgi:hypothetical protein
MAGLLVAAKETDLPMALFELGASAGLNLNLDRYAYRLGSLTVGDTRSKVALAPAWEGSDPPAATVRVIRRRGVDLSPIDITQPSQQDRLIAYIWADQSERIARLKAAIGIAAANPPPIDQGDAGDWVVASLPAEPEAGVARVLMHSLAFQYFPEDTRAKVTRHAERVGAAATKASPFHWLRFEADHTGQTMLRLQSWPPGTDHLLASGHAHASWIKWVPES